MPDLAARVLHRDRDLLVLDKPAGLAVHPGPRTPDSLETRLDELRFGERRSPQPAHRLDRDTSGCLALGRRPAALRRLHALFAGGLVDKLYWALVEGSPDGDDGIVDRALAKRSTLADGWRMVADPAGKPARTAWRVLVRAPRSLVEFRPATGRTHQIRVHAAELGCPIVGDPVYGSPGPAMLLHARSLTFRFPDAPPLTVVAPARADLPRPPGL